MNIKKLIMILVSPIIIIGIMFPGIVANTFLYYLNGSILILDKYKIEFPLSHWAYFEENDLTHILSGRKVNGKVLRIEVFRQPNKIDLNKIISKCDTSKTITKKYNNISGTQYICDYDDKSMMYFISTDRNIVLSSNDSFSHKHEKELQEYELLFNSISPLQ